MKIITLVKGRYELLNSSDRLQIYDVLSPDDNGRPVMVETIPLRGPISDRDAGRLALSWLLAYEYFTQSEYLNFLDTFLAVCPA